MFLMCGACHEPREVWDTECSKCGAALDRVAPCLFCKGKGYTDSGDGPEDCEVCKGMGCV